ncbi:hypothetical protein KC343_g22 [Hortaea werneckii]|nr:hypothetical protein KC317_g23 [Hortaea werneckii]KAI7628726.1 hypothetical protein KC346_g24 [Hortaea werneckii]KAI7638506.1 hypothetical protein KC343_g22 [Hortaea werneckii]
MIAQQSTVLANSFASIAADIGPQTIERRASRAQLFRPLKNTADLAKTNAKAHPDGPLACEVVRRSVADLQPPDVDLQRRPTVLQRSWSVEIVVELPQDSCIGSIAPDVRDGVSVKSVVLFSTRLEQDDSDLSFFFVQWLPDAATVKGPETLCCSMSILDEIHARSLSWSARVLRYDNPHPVDVRRTRLQRHSE